MFSPKELQHYAVAPVMKDAITGRRRERRLRRQSRGASDPVGASDSELKIIVFAVSLRCVWFECRGEKNNNRMELEAQLSSAQLSSLVVVVVSALRLGGYGFGSSAGSGQRL